MIHIFSGKVSTIIEAGNELLNLINNDDRSFCTFEKLEKDLSIYANESNTAEPLSPKSLISPKSVFDEDEPQIGSEQEIKESDSKCIIL